MRLRNKRTGEIYDLKISPDYDDVMSGWKIENKDFGVRYYSHLAELYAEWENAPEEPKEHWAIDQFGEPINVTGLSRLQLEKLRQYGNDFGTPEQAEKAVEKLKAFANLRKRGLKFNGWTDADRGIVGEFEIYCDALELDGIEQELEAVFGREEV